MISDEIYKVLQRIGDTPGRNSKIALMPDDEDFKKVLTYAVTPSLKFYINKTPANWIGRGEGQFDDQTYRLLNVLSTRRLSGNKAKSTTYSYLQGLTEESAKLFCMILKKDLRCGLGSMMVNLRFPNHIPVFRVMKAEVFDKNRVQYPCWVSPKIDGYRAWFQSGNFWSRGGHLYKGLDHLVRYLSHLGVHTALDGELVIPGVEFNTAGGRLRSGGHVPEAIYCVFDLPLVLEDFSTRMFLMDGILGVSDTEASVQIVRHLRADSYDHIMNYYNSCKRQGYEGVMVKTFDYKYQKRRSFHWMKIKPENTEDLRCVDVYEGTGKYRGKLGGIVVDRGGVETRVGSGFTDKERVFYYDHSADIIGRTIEVLFTEGTKTGRLRHSRFVRIRHDK